jgi:hypothetical protein
MVMTVKMSKKVLGIVVFAALFAATLLLVVIDQPALAAIDPLSVNELTDRITSTVLANGDLAVSETITFSASAFQKFKAEYPIQSQFKRIFSPRNTPIQMENFTMSLDEMNNKLSANYILKGKAVNKGESLWEIIAGDEGEKISLSAQTGNTLVFTMSTQSGDFRQDTTNTVTFPSGAKNIEFDSAKNVISYELPYNSGGNIAFLGLAIVLAGLAAGNWFVMKY